MAKEKLLMVGGNRKTSIAKAKILNGDGKVIINNVPYGSLNTFHRLAIEEPLKIAQKILKKIDFDIYVNITGGGLESQIEAARLAIAKILVEKTKSMKLKEAFLSYDRHLLVADVRRKEAYKPGDSKARAKRQTSYR